MRILAIAAALLVLAGCQTSNGDGWNGPRLGTSYRQAEKTCLGEANLMTRDANRREFFVGCMGALGWTPKPGAEIEF